MTEPVNLVWFKRDLRVVDHCPLVAAAARGRVLPLYIAEPQLWTQPDASARQWAFAAECLNELNKALIALGQPLSVMMGEALVILEKIRQTYGIAALWSHEETGIHWSQVQMQSGTTGINTARIYNPIKQGYDHDEQGLFIRKYVPELANIPDAFVHEPWLWFSTDTSTYPAPIVDCVAAAKAAREAIHAVRKRPDHQLASQQIVQKHGSRKSSKPTTVTKPRTKKAPTNTDQLTMDF